MNTLSWLKLSTNELHNLKVIRYYTFFGVTGFLYYHRSMIDSYFRREFTQNKGNTCSSAAAWLLPAQPLIWNIRKNKSEKSTTEALVSIWLQENCTSAYTGRDVVKSERDRERQTMRRKSFWGTKEQVFVGKWQELGRSCQHTQQLNAVLHKDSTHKHEYAVIPATMWKMAMMINNSVMNLMNQGEREREQGSKEGEGESACVKSHFYKREEEWVVEKGREILLYLPG